MEKHDDVRAAFTAYMAAAAKYTKGHYMAKKINIEDNEILLEEEKQAESIELEAVFRRMNNVSVRMRDEVQEMQFLLDQISDQRLFLAVMDLSEMQKKVILLRVLFEKSFPEIGRKLGITTRKAENVYYYAIGKIRKKLEEK